MCAFCHHLLFLPDFPIETRPRSADGQHLAMALPELNDDAIAEILTCLPPDDPAPLQRFALVYKSWRRILSDPAFHSHHRAYHRTPPLFVFLRGFHSGPVYNYMVDVKTLQLENIGEGNSSSCIFPFMSLASTLQIVLAARDQLPSSEIGKQ